MTPKPTPVDTSADIDIYAEMLAAGVALDSHESDMYAEVTPASRAIVARYQHRDNVRTFTDAVTGKLMFDVPFSYRPFWNQHGRW